MRDSKGVRWARGIGFLAGLSIAIAAVVAWRIPPGTGTLGTDLTIAVVPTGELDVSAPGPFVTGTGLRPGTESDAPSGSVKVRNETGSTLSFRVKVVPSIADLDRLLWIEVEAGGAQLFRGPLGDLREASERTFRLASGQKTTIGVRAWLPASVTSGYEGRIESVDLTFVPLLGGA